MLWMYAHFDLIVNPDTPISCSAMVNAVRLYGKWKLSSVLNSIPSAKKFAYFSKRARNLLSPMAYNPRTITAFSPLKFFTAFKKLLAPEKIEV